MIMPYNRVVKDLNGHDKQEFMDEVSKIFDVTASDVPVEPQVKGQVGMYMDGSWYRLDVREGIVPDDVVGRLDVSVLQDNVLAPILGIQDPRTDQRIMFVGGIRGLAELERLVEEWRLHSRCIRHPSLNCSTLQMRDFSCLQSQRGLSQSSEAEYLYTR